MSLPKTLTVEVTEDDIKNGIPQKACKCPIALAICRQLGYQPDDNYVDVAKQAIHVLEKDAEPITFGSGFRAKPLTQYHLPVNAQDFVERFDDYEDVYPFSFTALFNAVI